MESKEDIVCGVPEHIKDPVQILYRLVLARGRFALEYCKLKGWPLTIAELSLDQIREIRSQPEWKTPIQNYGK